MCMERQDLTRSHESIFNQLNLIYLFDHVFDPQMRFC